MTRKEFLTHMIKSLFGCISIEFKHTYEDRVEYTKTGTLIKDCTYTENYYNKVVQLICSPFEKEVKYIKIDRNEELSRSYYQKSRGFIVDILEDFSSEPRQIYHFVIYSLDVDELRSIYNHIIIRELFDVKNSGKKVGNDDFSDSEEKIKEMINSFLKPSFFKPVDDKEYEERRQAFLKAVHDRYKTDNYISGSEFGIYYKSSELGKVFFDIKEYIKEKNYAFVNLNEKDITEFKLNTVYRYTGPCCLETADNNQIIISFNYNNQKIRSYTSRKNWINASILSNYTDPGTVLHCNCYFFFHQGKVFKFLQVSEADISAEI